MTVRPMALLNRQIMPDQMVNNTTIQRYSFKSGRCAPLTKMKAQREPNREHYDDWREAEWSILIKVVGEEQRPKKINQNDNRGAFMQKFWVNSIWK